MSHFTTVWLKENQVRLVGSSRSFTCNHTNHIYIYITRAAIDLQQGAQVYRATRPTQVTLVGSQVPEVYSFPGQSVAKTIEMTTLPFFVVVCGIQRAVCFPLGIDRLDYMKGIPHKLMSFGRFLENHPDWADKCVLVQLAVPSRRDVPEYQRLQRQVHELVGDSAEVRSRSLVTSSGEQQEQEQ